MYNWQCERCFKVNAGHSSICTHCPGSQKQLLDEMASLIKRHIERKDNGAPQHKNTYQDFKNWLQKYEALHS